MEKEEEWRLKSRVIWLKSGDENTKFFQKFTQGRKEANTIWDMKNEEGEKVSSFKSLAKLGVHHFQSLYKEQVGSTLAEIIQLAQLFPQFVDAEENIELMEEVMMEELKSTLHSFQKDKSPRPDGWTIEFYLGLFDILREDLLNVVEESRRTGRIHATINATFIALIPKVENPVTFDDFRSLSLCNCLYKIISKVISKRLKAVLSENISKEWFSFLQGRQIHQAIGVVQESLHSFKTKNLSGAVLKLDLFKAYDRVSWLYVRMLLIHLRFDVTFVR